MGSELIYLHDAYQREFRATVVALDPATRGVALDRTAFYPGGGGQPHDLGHLAAANTRWEIVSTDRQSGTAWHHLAGDRDLPDVSESLNGVLDWPRRYRLMRTHTAMHILCGVIFRDFGALVTGGAMGPDKARMDFEMEDLAPERIAEIQRRVNSEIGAGRDVKTMTLPRDEAMQIPDLIRTKINLLPEGITEIRIVEIVGLDLQADGGTHVANTEEVAGIRIVGTRSKGKSNKRLEIVLSGGEGDEAVTAS